jgi:hypothetical protein
VRAAVAAPAAEAAEVGAAEAEAGDFPALPRGLPFALPVGVPMPPPPHFRALDPMQGIR